MSGEAFGRIIRAQPRLKGTQLMKNWQLLSTQERRAVAEDLAREALQGFFDDYSGFKDMASNAGRRRAVDSVLLCLESRAILAGKET